MLFLAGVVGSRTVCYLVVGAKWYSAFWRHLRICEFMFKRAEQAVTDKGSGSGVKGRNPQRPGGHHLLLSVSSDKRGLAVVGHLEEIVSLVPLKPRAVKLEGIPYVIVGWRHEADKRIKGSLSVEVKSE
jgi:hypothetical protein